MGKYGKMPNEAKGHRAKAHPPKHKGGGNINKSSEMRSDVTKQVSNHHPYPKGLA